jgi:hypothetical protein
MSAGGATAKLATECGGHGDLVVRADTELSPEQLGLVGTTGLGSRTQIEGGIRRGTGGSGGIEAHADTPGLGLLLLLLLLALLLLCKDFCLVLLCLDVLGG